MKNPRINITLNASDLEVMHILCEQKKISMSALAKRMIEDWLEDYEDMSLSRRAEEAEKRAEGKPTYSHEEVCRKFGIE